MDDIAFASSVSTEIGRYYKEGKNLSLDLPKSALVSLRSLAVVFCRDININNESDRSIELFKKIILLEDSGVIDSGISFHLHILRRNGNKGAHPETFKYSHSDFLRLIEESLNSARQVIEKLYLFNKNDDAIPKYDVTAPPTNELRDICLRAVTENDNDSMCLVGLFLESKANDITKNEDVFRPSDRYGLKASPVIDQAMYWFKQAAEKNHTESMYRYGVYLSQLQPTSENNILGEIYVQRASENEHADALCEMGNFYYEGSQQFNIDYREAIKCFEKAALQEHPEALTQLGYMYMHGLGCTEDQDKSVQYSLLGAQAGYPVAQYNMYHFYINGEGIEKDELEALKWLNEAVSQEYLPAIYFRIIIKIKELKPSEPTLKIIEELKECLDDPELAKHVFLEIAVLKLRENELDAMIKAARNIQKCYELIIRDKDEHIKSRCLAVALEISNSLRKHVKTHGLSRNNEGDDLIACCLFDRKGVPIKSSENLRKKFTELNQGENRKANLEDLIEFLIKNSFVAKLTKKAITDIYAIHRQSQVTSKIKTGRNDPCWCGSEKKLKKCHVRP